MWQGGWPVRRKPNVLRQRLMVRLRAEGWTFEALGKRLGISPQAVQQALCPPAHRRTAGHAQVQCVVDQGRISAVVDWESARAANSAIDLAIPHAHLDY